MSQVKQKEKCHLFKVKMVYLKKKKVKISRVSINESVVFWGFEGLIVGFFILWFFLNR